VRLETLFDMLFTGAQAVHPSTGPPRQAQDER